MLLEEFWTKLTDALPSWTEEITQDQARVFQELMKKLKIGWETNDNIIAAISTYYTKLNELDIQKYSWAETYKQEAHRWLMELRSSLINTQLETLKKTHPELYKQLEQSWILLNDIENTGQLDKIVIYLDYLNYLYNVTRKSDESPLETSQELVKQEKINIVKKYKELLSESTDHIFEKEYITYKYLEAIIRDLNRMWYSIEKWEKWAYVIRSITTPFKIIEKKDYSKTIWVYAEILTTNTELIDTAIIANMLVNRPTNKLVFNQKQFVNKLFKDHGILDWVKDEDKTKYIWTRNAEILKQIEDKLETATTIQDIRELTYLRSLVTWYKQWDGKKEFNRANVYAKWFLKEKAFIQAYRAGKIPGMKDKNKSTPDMLSDFIKTNRASSIVFGIISWFMWYKKTAIWALWLWIFGWSIADIVSWVWNESADAFDGINDEINPIQLSNIAHLLEEYSWDYQTGYDKLVAYNNGLSWERLTKTSSGSYRKSGITPLDNNVLYTIVNKITYDSINIDLTKKDAATKLKTKLSWITLTNIKGKKVELDDKLVKKFIKILKWSGLKEDWDRTTLDYLSEWQDILNISYESVDFTGTELDSELNTVLGDNYKVLTSRQERKDLIKLRDYIKTEFWTFRWLIDNIQGWTFNSSSISTKISNMKNYIEANNNWLLSEISLILDYYSKYINIETELKPFEWVIDLNMPNIEITIYNIFWWATGTKLNDPVALERDITTKIKKLEWLLITDEDLLERAMFKSLNKRIQKLIKKLKSFREKLVEEHKETIFPSHATTFNIIQDFSNENRITDLSTDIQTRTKKISTTITSIDNLNFSVNDLQTTLESIKQDFTIMQIYVTNSTTSTTSTTGDKLTIDSNLDIVKTTQTFIKTKLTEFIAKKEELKQVVQAKLQAYFKLNQTHLITLDNINTSDISKLEEWLRALESVWAYITSTWSNNILWFDSSLANTMKLSRTMFGDEFMKGVDTTKLSLLSVNEKYKEKQKALKELATQYVSSFDISSIKISNNAVENIKKSAKLLKFIKLKYNLDITTQIKKIEKLYLESIKVKNEIDLVKAINLDINILENTTTSKEEKILISQLLWGLKSSLISNMTIWLLWNSLLGLLFKSRKQEVGKLSGDIAWLKALRDELQKKYTPNMYDYLENLFN